MSYISKKADILSDIGVSEWAKRAIMELGNRDILDALNDLELLQNTLMLKWYEAVRSLKAQKR